MKITKRGGFRKIFVFLILLSTIFPPLVSADHKFSHKAAVVELNVADDVEIGLNKAENRDIDDPIFKKQFTPFPECSFIDVSPVTVGLPVADDLKSGSFKIKVTLDKCVPPDAPPYTPSVRYNIKTTYMAFGEVKAVVDTVGSFDGWSGEILYPTYPLVGEYKLDIDFRIYVGRNLLTHQQMKHTLYFTVDKPQGNIRAFTGVTASGGFASSSTPVNSFPDGPKERWLEVATDWAGGTTKEKSAISKMNAKEYTNPFAWKYGYDTTTYPATKGLEINWEKMIDTTSGDTSDCNVFSIVLKNLAHVIGLATPAMAPYNPAVPGPAGVPVPKFITDTIVALDNVGINAEDINTHAKDRWVFNTHCTVKYRKIFYDPTFGLERSSLEEIPYAKYSSVYLSPSLGTAAVLNFKKNDGSTMRVTVLPTKNSRGWGEYRYKNPHLELPLGTGAAITKIISEQGVDTDNDGLFNYLNVTFEINVSESNNYLIFPILNLNESTIIAVGDLGSPRSSQKFIQTDDNTVNLSLGTYNLSSFFNGQEINLVRINGNYSIFFFVNKNDSQTFMGNFSLSFYNHTQFQGLTLDVLNITDFGSDIDGDGKFDSITLKLDINVTRNASYNISISLEDEKQTDLLITNNSQLNVGNVSLVFALNTLKLRISRSNGPYNVQISLSDEYYEKTILYNTSYYNFSQFEQSKIEFTGNFSETVFDKDGDSLFDFLIIEVGINVTNPNNYTIIGSLTNVLGNATAFATNATFISSNTSVLLMFNGMDIFESGINGPYNVTLLRISDAEGNLQDLLDNAFVTGSYNYTQFVPGSKILGSIVDSVGTPIPNASITAAGPTLDSVVSNISGNYIIQRLENGSYDIEIEPPLGFILGFNSTTINITSNETKFIDFTLEGIMPDIFPPEIQLISPINNSTIITNNTITFLYKVNDTLSNISYCSLFINSSQVQNDTFIEENIPQNFTQFLVNGTYNWSISCTDNSENANQGFSETRALIVNVNPVTIPACIDNDNDGYNQSNMICGTIDCNDASPSIYPGAPEVCNGADDNCNGFIDEGCPVTAQCGSTIMTDTVLTSDLICGGDGLIIGDDHIQLDCNGHSITTTSDNKGIAAVGRRNITIKNCNLNRFFFGIYLEGTNHSIIESNTINTPHLGGYGIFVRAENNLIKNNTVFNNSEAAIFIGIPGDHNIITDNNVRDSTTGIIVSGHNQTITKNKISKNLFGLHVASSNNTIKENILVENNFPFSRAMTLQFSYNNIIAENLVENNTEGIGLFFSDHNSITNNILENNNNSALRLFSSTNATVSFNIITKSPDYGLLLENTNNALITNNNFSSNNISIKLTSSNNNIIITNNLFNNTLGIWLDPSFNNLVYNNLFNNALNARDDGVNFWNTTRTSGVNIIGKGFLGGNFWNDYNGQDIDGDGLGDSLLPYTSLGGIQNNGDFLPLVGQACVSPPSSMIGWWTGDGNSDDILGVYNGTLRGATFILGKVGQAFSFDGVNDYVEIPDNQRLQPNSGSFAIDFWTRPSSVTPSARLIWKNDGDTPPHRGYFVMLSQGKYRFEVGDGLTSQGVDSLTSAIPGEWVHIAAVRDNAAGKIALYVNGVKEAEAIDPTDSVEYSVNLSLGGRPQIATEFYHGSIDEVEIFHRALSEQEIQTLYDAGSGGRCKIGWDDTDSDGVYDITDNCITISNPTQTDADNDGIGDACEVKFLRGDANTDGSVDISDPIKTLFYLYSNAQFSCKETADTNDDGKIDISDVIYTLDFLFKAGPSIKQPYPALGIDETPENPDLGCASYNPPIGGGGGSLTPEDVLKDPNTTQSVKDIIKPYACLLNGDVDQNKKVDMNDYYSLSYALSGRFKIDELCKCNADVNEDTVINQNDVSALYNYLRYKTQIPKEGECEKPTLSSPIASPSPSPYK